jgi:hypothetical protein
MIVILGVPSLILRGQKSRLREFSMDGAIQCAAVSKAANATVERPRDPLSDAPRVHNEVAQMRHARDAV